MSGSPAIGRLFRLHLLHGLVLDGWVTADGQAVAIETPEWIVTAPSLEDLVRGYGGGRVEWPPPTEHHPAPPAQQGDTR
ncbi:hypothetical protein [Streptomyces sp. NPDC056160]|uniref:hypothetical protein n=1 Tax=Streptomyces sp. NPDC056160 TaxID=3345731 RepID=UPI0035E3A166